MASAVVLFVVAVCITHGRSFRGEFVFDDTGAILDNPSIRTLTSLKSVMFDNKFTTVAGRPLLNLSLAVNYAIGGRHPVGYHLFNYLVHAAGAYVLFSLLRRLLKMFDQTSDFSEMLALVISLLWCVHPLTVNGVSYIVQRGESMASFCYLAVLWSFVKGIQSSQRRWFLVSVSAAWLGSLTKEIIATVPLTVIALDLLVVTRDWRLAIRNHWRVYLALMTSWIPLALCMSASRDREASVGFAMGISLQEHIQTQAWAVAHYLSLIVWPNPLVFDYGPEFTVTDPQQLAIAASLVAGYLLLTVWLVVRRSPLAFPCVAIVLLLGPTSVIPIVTQTVAEHRMYLASACGITWIVLVLFLGMKRLRGFATLPPVAQRLAIFVACIPMVLALGLLTAQRSKVFLTADSIWNDTLQKQPTNQRSYLNLGHSALEVRGDHSEALRMYGRAIEVNGPLTRHAYEVRGELQRKLGQIEAALDDFSHAIALHPDIIEDRYHRASILRDLRRFDEAIRDLDEARRIDPKNRTTDLLVGSVYAASEKLLPAFEIFDRLLAQDSQYVAARRRRAELYVRLNRWDEAQRDISHLQKAQHPIDSKLLNAMKNHLATLSK
jgi:Tfp pilus assembly protein PilF